MLEEPVMWLRYRHFSHLQGMIMSAAKNMNNVNNIVRGGCSWRGPIQCNDLLPNGGLLKSNSGLPKLLEDQMKCDNKLEEIWSTFWEEHFEENWSTFWRNLINNLQGWPAPPKPPASGGIHCAHQATRCHHHHGRCHCHWHWHRCRCHCRCHCRKFHNTYICTRITRFTSFTRITSLVKMQNSHSLLCLVCRCHKPR